MSRSARWWPPLALLGLALTSASAQDEFDRARPPPDRRRGTAPVDTRTVPRVKPAGPRTASDPLDPDTMKDLPDKDREEAKARTRKKADWIELKHSGKLFTSFGHDTNVFRSDRNRTTDGFFRGHGEVELLAKFPKLREGSEFFVEVSGETLLYFERTKANEHFLSAFVEYFHPVYTWLDIGVQNAFEFSRLNLLDDNGDLFPRGRFGSLDEEVRLFAILSPDSDSSEGGGFTWDDMSFELGGSYRLKDYEENRGTIDASGNFTPVESLDYEEVRLDASIAYKITRRPRSRLKLKYRFRRRDYREFTARDRDGTVSAGAPRLDLHRHQFNLRWFQSLQTDWFKGRFVVGLGAVYNRDLHQNDRSYREASLSLSGEWWIVEKLTRLDLSLRGVLRNFIVRKRQKRDPTTGQDVSAGGHLRHRLLRIKVGLWQRVHRVERSQGPGRSPLTLLTLAVFADATATVWRSADVGEDYDRFVIQGGLEASW